METLEAIEKRRSVKHFDPNHKMTEQEVSELLSHAILSPTSFNIQNWRIVNVVDSEMRQKVKEAAWGQAQVADASLLLVLCADLRSFEKDTVRYWKNAPEEVRNFMVENTVKFYSNNDQLQRDEAMRSTGLMGQTIMLAAKSMGYDSCPMVGFDPVKVAEIIKLPKDHVVSYLVVVGKATKEARARAGQLPLNEVIVTDHF